MKAKEVPALRSKRGLHRASGAEPPWVGLAPQTMKEKKADTMKTYLLKTSPTVEPKAGPKPARQKPSTSTSMAGASSRGSQPSPPASEPALFIGLDVHNDPIAVSIAAFDRGPGKRVEVRTARAAHFGPLD